MAVFAGKTERVVQPVTAETKFAGGVQHGKHGAQNGFVPAISVQKTGGEYRPHRRTEVVVTIIGGDVFKKFQLPKYRRTIQTAHRGRREKIIQDPLCRYFTEKIAV